MPETQATSHVNSTHNTERSRCSKCNEVFNKRILLFVLAIQISGTVLIVVGGFQHQKIDSQYDRENLPPQRTVFDKSVREPYRPIFPIPSKQHVSYQEEKTKMLVGPIILYASGGILTVATFSILIWKRGHLMRSIDETLCCCFALQRPHNGNDRPNRNASGCDGISGPTTVMSNSVQSISQNVPEIQRNTTMVSQVTKASSSLASLPSTYESMGPNSPPQPHVVHTQNYADHYDQDMYIHPYLQPPAYNPGVYPSAPYFEP